MDFSTAFKADTRRGKKKKKAAKPAASEGNPDVMEADALDDVNRDLEEVNL